MNLWFKMLAWVTGVAAVLLGAMYLFFWDVWIIPGDDSQFVASILPILGPGDVVILPRRPSVGRGNLVRCADPQTPGRFVVARAIGLSGDTVELTGEVVTIDGHRTPSPRACEPGKLTIHDPGLDEDVDVQSTVEEYGDRDFCALRSAVRPESPTRAPVENGKVYLVSDDRHVHFDSRDFGQVDPSTCQHILFRVVGPTGLGDADKRFTIIW